MEQQGINLRPPEETRQIIDALFKFIESEIIPLEKENKKLLESEVNMYEPSGYLKREVLELRKYVRKKSAKAGFLNMFVPKELGGMGLGPLTSVFTNISLHAKYGPGRPLITSGKGLLIHPLIAGFVDGPSPVILELSDEQKKRKMGNKWTETVDHKWSIC
jgi:acyl-CoA dehydrogenase